MNEAQQQFAQNLAGPQGVQAREYLAQRGFSPEKILEYRFGWSLDDNASLTQHLIKDGFRHEELVACSLSNQSRQGNSHYDFFRNRVMLPICDGRGRIIAFADRTLGSEQPKYRNSRETFLFNKSSLLFGLHAARTAIREKGPADGYAIIVEGYMGALQCWNFGFPQTVACMGTALSVAHLRQIAQITRQIYLIFDGDGAGHRANLNTVKSALQIPGLSIRVVLLPGGEDPDDFLRAKGAEPLRALMEEATDLLDYAITTRLVGVHGLGVAELIENEFVPWLRSIENPFHLVVLIKRLAELTGIPYAVVERLVQGTYTTPGDNPLPRRRNDSDPNPLVQRLAPQAKQNARIMPSFHSPQFALLGNMYFASPDDIDINLACHLLQHEIEYDDAFLALGMCMINHLAEGNGSVGSKQDPAWMSGLHHDFSDFMEVLKQHADAFKNIDHNRQLLNLSRLIKIKKLEKSRADLKDALLLHEGPGANRDGMLHILTAIREINAEIKNLEKIDNP